LLQTNYDINMSLEGQRTTTGALQWDDFKSLIAKMERDGEYKYCLLIVIGVFTGLRISDLLRLRYSQVLDNDVMTIVEQKTKKTRRIKINDDMKAIVIRIKAKIGVSDSDQYIFLNRFGTKPVDKSFVNVKLKELFKKYGVQVDGNISSHLFRKTLGNRVVKLNNYSNESIVLLMDLFGHSSMGITKRYLGIREKEVLDVYDSLSL